MTMTVDSQQRFSSINLHHMLPYSGASQFSHPWTSSAPSQGQSLYASSSSISPSLGLSNSSKAQGQSLDQAAFSSYARLPVAAPAAGVPLLADTYGSQELLAAPQDMLLQNRSMPTSFGHDSHYGTVTSPVPQYGASSSPFDSLGYVAAPVRSTYALQQQQQQQQQPQPQHHSRRLSHSSVPANPLIDTPNGAQRAHRQNAVHDYNDRSMSNDSTRAFSEAIDASRGMLAMSQNTTPRNIFEAHQGRAVRASIDSYGFPSTHSASSSVSSLSNYQSYLGGGMESSVSDYSNAGSDIESISSRTLPRPSHTGCAPPAPQSMMGQFSSKVSSSSQKKHKCKVCDKRFTRPSSLQTHMYSHTGEKPFSCEVEGCGRHFSVVSNLRRHHKVHKGDAQSEAGSEDHQSDE